MGMSAKAFLIISYIIMTYLCFYWKSRVKKANKMLSYYVDESYYCTNCEEYSEMFLESLKNVAGILNVESAETEKIIDEIKEQINNRT